MEHNNSVTVYREYQNLYDEKTLIKKIIHIESEILSGTDTPPESIISENEFLFGTKKQYKK